MKMQELQAKGIARAKALRGEGVYSREQKEALCAWDTANPGVRVGGGVGEVQV